MTTFETFSVFFSLDFCYAILSKLFLEAAPSTIITAHICTERSVCQQNVRDAEMHNFYMTTVGQISLLRGGLNSDNFANGLHLLYFIMENFKCLRLLIHLLKQLFR